MVGGIILNEDVVKLKNMGVVNVYFFKDFNLNDIMEDIVDLVDKFIIVVE